MTKEVKWPEEAGAGVPLHTLYLKTETTWEYYSNVAWNPWPMDEIKGESDGEGVDEANKAQERHVVKFPNEGMMHSQIPK
jgi:hypothetical protein